MLDLLVTAVQLVVAGDVFDGVFLCCPFPHEMSWMRVSPYIIHSADYILF